MRPEMLLDMLTRARAKLGLRGAAAREDPLPPVTSPPWDPALSGLPLLVPVALHAVRDNALFVRDGRNITSHPTEQPADDFIYFDWAGHRSASLKVEAWLARRAPFQSGWRQNGSTGEISNTGEIDKPRITIEMKFPLVLDMTAIELLRVVQAEFDAHEAKWTTSISANRTHLLIRLASYVVKLTGVY